MDEDIGGHISKKAKYAMKVPKKTSKVRIDRIRDHRRRKVP